MKGQTTAVDLFYFGFALIAAGAFVPVFIEAIGMSWGESSLLLKSIYVALPGTFLFGIFSEILTSREIETIRRNERRNKRRRI